MKMNSMKIPTNIVTVMDNPEYFHLSALNGAGDVGGVGSVGSVGGSSAFTPVRSSSPHYIGEYLHPRTLAPYQDDDVDMDDDLDVDVNDMDMDLNDRYRPLANSGT